jgi:1-pyrroline-5-carboxylate dehydrogenase
MPTEFRNEPFTDFSKEENANAMRAALAKVKSQLGREYPLVIGGERITTEAKLDSINPANRTEVVGRFQKATKELANQAVESAFKAFQSWKKTSAEDRADLLFRVAAIIRERKHELSAWMIHEVAKSWPEADGDTAAGVVASALLALQALK